MERETEKNVDRRKMIRGNEFRVSDPHLMSEDNARLDERFRQQHRVLLVNERICRAMYQQVILREEIGGV
jgi:hypothetical protein